MLTVQIVPREGRYGYGKSFDVCAAGHGNYNFPTRGKAVEFCKRVGFTIYSEKAKKDPARSKCKCVIYNSHYSSSPIRREFGEISFTYRKMN